MARRDDLNVLYDKPKLLEKGCRALFWSNVIISLIALFCNGPIRSVCVLIQLIIVILYLIIRNIDDGIFWYEAEKIRRKANLQSAFAISFSEYDTEEYYNNALSPSLRKYAVNTFESNYFSKKIAGRMLVCSVTKAVFAIITLVVTSWFLADGDVLLIIAQSIFSSYVLEETIMLIIYKVRMDKLYDECFAELVTIGIKTKEQKIWLLSYIVEYEAVKAHYKVRLNSKLFERINAELSNSWTKIEKLIK